MNPDNLATPLAASIGDVVSLSVLSFIASLLYENLGMSSAFNFSPKLLLSNGIVIDTVFNFDICSHTFLGYIRGCCIVFCVAAILDNDCSLQQIHTISIEVRLGARAISAVHQRVSVSTFLIFFFMHSEILTLSISSKYTGWADWFWTLLSAYSMVSLCSNLSLMESVGI